MSNADQETTQDNTFPSTAFQSRERKPRSTPRLRPLHDRVLIRRAEADETTKAGLFIPEGAKERPVRGTVLAVGPGKLVDGNRVPLAVSVGEVVLFTKYSGSEVTIDGETLLLMGEDEVLGVLDNPSAS